MYSIRPSLPGSVQHFNPTSYLDSLLADHLAGRGVDECLTAQPAHHLHRTAVHHKTVVPRQVAEARCHTVGCSWMEAADIAGCGYHTVVDAAVVGREEEKYKVVALSKVS